MDIDEFWTLIERARAAGDGDPEAVTEHLAAELAGGPELQILQFQLITRQLSDRAYDWRLWAAAYLIGGGCSDDSFLDFRAGLILQGREAFERALHDPDSLADLQLVQAVAASEDLDEGDLFFEDANYIAPFAFERRRGDTSEAAGAFTAALRTVDDRHNDAPLRPSHEDFDFDDGEEMRRRLPHLAALFSARR